MNDRNRKELPEDRLEKAVMALRAERAAEGPSEELLTKTIARVGAGEIQSTVARKEWWTMRAVRRSAAAAGIVLMATAGILWLLLGRGATVAFADVVQQVLAAKAVRCTVNGDVQEPGKGVQTSASDLLIVEPDWMIDTAASVKFIMNRKEGRGLMLMEKGKQAIVVDESQPAVKMQGEANLIAQFRKIQGKEGKPLGEKEIDGIKARGFEITDDTGRVEVWADEKTERPVLVVTDIRSPFLPAMTIRFSKFDWNPQYDPAELTLNVPAGYTVTKVNGAAVTEGDVVDMLRDMATLNSGVFPEHLAVADYVQSLPRARDAKLAGMPPEEREQAKKDFGAQALKATQEVARGWGFMMDKKQGSDWHYAGQGVKQGDKGKAVLWYKPAGKEIYRVFDADLTVHEATAAELPAGERLQTDVMFPGTTRGK